MGGKNEYDYRIIQIRVLTIIKCSNFDDENWSWQKGFFKFFIGISNNIFIN